MTSTFDLFLVTHNAVHPAEGSVNLRFPIYFMYIHACYDENELDIYKPKK